MKSGFYESIRPEHIFSAALIIFPSFIFQEILVIKYLQVFIFAAASFLFGKKIRILPPVIMTAGIVSANLLTPAGEVLFQLFNFPFTKGAFLNGLDKSALITGTVYLSKFALSRNLNLPGGRGSLFSSVIFYFEKIMEGEKQKSVKKDPFQFSSLFSFTHLIEKIDRKIIKVYESSAVPPVNAEKTGNNDKSIRPLKCRCGFIFLFIFVLFNWSLFFYSLV